ncbi:MAG: protein-disulfide reductase, partial [Bacteroidota bacterium]|nr:protein-disulfide reductase [Bacteroidota bacterium]
MMKNIVFTVFVLCFISIVFPAFASDTTAVQFKFGQQRINNNEVLLSITATTAKNISLYALHSANNDALYSTVQFDSAAQSFLLDSVTERGIIHTERDATVDAAVRFFSDSVIWNQKVKLPTSDSAVLKGTVTYLYKKGDEYVPGEKTFTFYIHPLPAATATVSAVTNSVENKTLIWIFFTAFAGGLLALFTPCVYSMIPVTVSFFTKRSKSKKEGIKNALYYAGSIILIFTLLGFLITLIFGPAALNNLATNWIANLIFFLLFLVFGISFLGAFDISLPSNWSTKADSKAGLKSFSGIFFMALTLVVVSFSCTGPIIGNLLVLAAKGNYYGPLVGMFGFSVALALPFALFAFFPSKLNVLGKAGGWLNAVKVTLG